MKKKLSFFFLFFFLSLEKRGSFHRVSDGKESACNAGDLSSIPGLGGSPGEGNGNPIQYSCVENSMDRGAWQAIVHGVAKSQIWLSDLTEQQKLLDNIKQLLDK